MQPYKLPYWISHFLIGIVLVASSSAESAGTVDEVLTFAAGKSAAYKDWSADLVQSISMGGATMEQKGSLTFKTPMQMKVNFSTEMMGQPMTTHMVAGSDGIAWVEATVAGQKQVMKMDLKKMMQAANPGANPVEETNPMHQIQKFKQFFDLQVKDGEPHQGQETYLLEGVIKPNAATEGTDSQLAAALAMASKIRILIGKKDGFPHKTEMFDKKDRAIFSQELSNLKFNQDLSDDFFTYTPPEGVAVMDLSKMMQPAAGSGAAPSPASEPAAEPVEAGKK